MCEIDLRNGLAVVVDDDESFAAALLTGSSVGWQEWRDLFPTALLG